jgi:hypothetical protein
MKSQNYYTKQFRQMSESEINELDWREPSNEIIDLFRIANNKSSTIFTTIWHIVIKIMMLCIIGVMLVITTKGIMLGLSESDYIRVIGSSLLLVFSAFSSFMICFIVYDELKSKPKKVYKELVNKGYFEVCKVTFLGYTEDVENTFDNACTIQTAAIQTSHDTVYFVRDWVSVNNCTTPVLCRLRIPSTFNSNNYTYVLLLY